MKYPLAGDLQRETTTSLTANPAWTTRRAADFKDTGNYEVISESGEVVALIFRDPDDREWYRAMWPGEIDRAHSPIQHWLGSTKGEAIERLASRSLAKNPSESPDEREAAVERYKTFHRYDPKDVGEFPASFAIPAKMKCAGPAKWTTYRSGKVDPATLKLPKRPVNYIHEHDAGVHVYVPVDDDDFDGKTVTVPREFREVGALTKLGESLGYCVKVDDDELEAESVAPLPELYCSSDGKCLYVVQDKREVLAMIWGGALGVFARGIDG